MKEKLSKGALTLLLLLGLLLPGVPIVAEGQIRLNEGLEVTTRPAESFAATSATLHGYPDSVGEPSVAIRETIHKPEGPIYPSDLEGLTSLDARERNIADLTGLEYCSNLSELQLWGNEISDISPLADLTNLTSLVLGDNQISDFLPLAGLTGLTSLSLHSNQISDISVLVDNNGLGEGDEVDLRWNPLSEQSINEYIPALEARGVTVDY